MLYAAEPTIEELLQQRKKLMAVLGKGLNRLRLQAALDTFVASLLVVFSTLPFLTAADRLLALSELGWSWPILWFGLLAMILPVTLWFAFSPKITAASAAALLDERLRLQTRFGTALALERVWGETSDDFARTPAERCFANAFYLETAARMPSVNPQRTIPLQLAPLAWFLPLPLLLAAGLWWRLPQRDLLGFAEERRGRTQEREKQNKAAERLNKFLDLKKDVLQDPTDDEKDGGLQGLAQAAGKIAEDLEKGERTPQENLVELGKLREKIEERKNELMKGKSFVERLENLGKKDAGENPDSPDGKGDSLSKDLLQGDTDAAARSLRRLGRSLEQAARSGDAQGLAEGAREVEKLREELERLAAKAEKDPALQEKLQELARQLAESEYEGLNAGKPMTDEQAEKMAEQLERLAEFLEGLGEEDEVLLDDSEEEELAELEILEDDVEEAMDELCEGGDGEKPDKIRISKNKNKKGQGGRKIRIKTPSKSACGKCGSRGCRGACGGQSRGQSDPGGQPGGGMGGGPGSGQRPEGDGGETEYKTEKVSGRMQRGAIESLSHFRGQGAKGPPPKAFSQALKQAEQEDVRALELERIPAEAREVVKNYFSNLQGKGDGNSAAGATEP
jgi:hypothetical protein